MKKEKYCDNCEYFGRFTWEDLDNEKSLGVFYNVPYCDYYGNKSPRMCVDYSDKGETPIPDNCPIHGNTRAWIQGELATLYNEIDCVPCFIWVQKGRKVKKEIAKYLKKNDGTVSETEAAELKRLFKGTRSNESVFLAMEQAGILLGLLKPHEEKED